MTLDILHAALVAVLLLVAFLDARSGRIPNWAIFLIVGLFAVKAYLFPGAVSLYWQAGVAVAVLIAGIGLFMLGGLGAGAVKLAVAVTLFMPLGQWHWLLATFVGSVIIFLLVFSVLRSTANVEKTHWVALKKRVIPMAFPIGTTALVGLYLL
jgi:prepilin peptidase CpaA